MPRPFHLLRRFLPLLLGVGVLACVEPFEPNLNLEGQRLTVEGTITDSDEPQVVKLSYALAKPFSEFEIAPIGGATVQVLVNGQTTLNLRETASGTYSLPDGFRGKVGERYQLKLILPNGVRYESTEEIMPAVARIDTAYDRFDPQAIQRNLEKTAYWPAHNVYVNFTDPPGQRNFYSWEWTLWEKQDWCASCQRSLLINGRCAGFATAAPTGWYDYNCQTKCWDLFFSEQPTIFADTYSDGRTVTGQLTAQIPYYQGVIPIAAGALVELRQSSLTPAAYRYYKLLIDQTQNTGGLADTPPAPLVGNVRNPANPDEIVTGYFTASAVVRYRHWIDRRTGSGPPIGLFQATTGRDPNLEPFNCPPRGDCRPPTMICIPSTTRTPDQPDGWQGF